MEYKWLILVGCVLFCLQVAYYSRPKRKATQAAVEKMLGMFVGTLEQIVNNVHGSHLSQNERHRVALEMAGIIASRNIPLEKLTEGDLLKSILTEAVAKVMTASQAYS